MAKSEGRPGKNSDGQKKKPSKNPDGQSKPGASAGAQRGPDPAAAGSGATPSLVPPGLFAPGAGGTSDARSVTNFKDLPPDAQPQALTQMGLDPNAGQAMAQQIVQGSIAQPAMDGNGVPNAMMGPGLDPELANLPNDLAALQAKIGPMQQHIAQGFSPGASNMEHEVALNASALARAHAAQAVGKAQQVVQGAAARAQIGGLLQQLHATGQMPPPEQMASQMVGAPQLQQGSY